VKSSDIPRKKEKNLTGVKEIASRAGVSIATVDRVIHNRPGVSDKTREKIDRIIQELNYQPNVMASRLASGKTNRLAALIPEVTEETDFWSAPLKGIRRAATEVRQFGIEVDIFLFNPREKSSFSLQYETVLGTPYDGVVLSPAFVGESKEFIRRCQALKIPFVFIDSNIPGEESLSYIGPPYFQSGYLGAKLLTYRLGGKSRILVIHIAAESRSFNYLHIENGFRAYFNDNRLSNEVMLLHLQETDYRNVTNQLADLFTRHPDIAGIFVTNSQVSTVASFLSNHQRKEVPLIGFDCIADNIRYLKMGVIDFLICHQPEEQGYRALMSLYQYLVLGQIPEREYFMPIDIITKENQEYYKN